MSCPRSQVVRSRARWRNRRLTWLRVTAPPTALETTKPTRGCRRPPPFTPPGTLLGTLLGTTRPSEDSRKWTTINRPPQRRPRRTTSRNSTGEVKRLREESTPGWTHLRQRGGRGPCDGERRAQRDRPACACADGSRASCDDGGCSAGTCACSTYSLHSRVLLGESGHRSDASRPSLTRIATHQAPLTHSNGTPAPCGGESSRRQRRVGGGADW